MITPQIKWSQSHDVWLWRVRTNDRKVQGQSPTRDEARSMAIRVADHLARVGADGWESITT